MLVSGMPEHTTSQEPFLPPEPAAATVVVNAACHIREQGGEKVVLLHGVPAFRWHCDDAVSELLVAAQLLDLGHAKAVELSRAMEPSLRAIFRARQAYLEGGAQALAPSKRGPKGPRLGEAREASIARWYEAGVSNTEMARRLRVSEGTVRNALRRMGLPARRARREPEQTELPARALDPCPEAGDPSPETPAPAPVDSAELPAAAEQSDDAQAEPSQPLAVLCSLDSDPDDRVIDRMLAYMGKLLDAAPLFKDRTGLARLGVLLAVPLIVQSGVLQAAQRVYGDIGPAFYGLRTSLMALLFMALLRIKNPESLKCYNPAELGWLLGLDRAPEMKTVRRKLLRLGDNAEPTEAFLRELVQRRVAARQQALGFLYVDGHVRVYNGKAVLPKAHVARMRICLPAVQELWVNDAQGSPLFFVTQEAHGQLVSELPGVLAEVRKLLGHARRVTVVFDRGGWSPDLFARMDADGFDVLTYRKGRVEPLAAELFTTQEVPDSHGREHYQLADTEITVGTRRLAMRQVTRRTVGRKGTQHQTHIVTTRRDLSAVQVAWRMFERWRQENFFKYMRQEFAIDALVQHGTEAADPGREVPNPAVKAATAELAAARAELRRLQADYGDALASNDEKKRPTVRGLKIAMGTESGNPLRAAAERVEELVAARAALPKRLPVGEVNDEVVRLARSRKRLSDGLKMLAFQVETDLVTLVTPHYQRAAEDGRRLVAAGLQSRGDIEVRRDELRVTLAPQASPHRTRAIAALCAELNATDTRFPGTNLRLCFAVQDDDRASSTAG